MDLQKDMVVMLLSMLEGRSSNPFFCILGVSFIALTSNLLELDQVCKGKPDLIPILSNSIVTESHLQWCSVYPQAQH